MAIVNGAGRWILGLWFILIGVDHWAHVAHQTYGTGIAVELAKAFYDTGLAACAAVLLVMAGALLLANRLTVIALMAGLSVFAGASYWAVLTLQIVPILVVGATLLSIALLLLTYWNYLRQLFAMRTPNSVETGEETNLFARRATIFSYYLWGGWWVISGLFHFVLGPIIGTSPLAVQIMIALLHTRMYELVKAIETIGGLAILLRRWAPLLLVVNVPVTFVVMYWDVVLQDPGNPIGIGVGILTFCTTTILLWSYRLYLRPLATWAPQPFVSEAADIR